MTDSRPGAALKICVSGLLLAALAVPAIGSAAPSGASVARAGGGHRAAMDLTQYVNPLTGTNAGALYPGAATPFGMVQMGPDTPDSRYANAYYYNDKTINDFSTTHLSGPGCNAKGDVPVLPVTGPLKKSPGSHWFSYSPALDHSTEVAQPGYYAITLPHRNVRVEETATTRTGFVRLTYPSTTQATILLNGSRNNSGERGGSIKVVSDNEVTGQVNGGGACSNPQDYPVYYEIQFQQPFTSFGTWHGGTLTPGSRASKGKESGAYVTFDTTSNQQVQMKVALSYVSLAGAQQAMTAEDPGWDFSSVRSAGDTDWEDMLNRVQVTGGTTTDLQKFYTALYHVFLTPNVNSDTNGDYRGFDGKVHQSSRPVYQDYSGWDIYRSWFPLIAMLAPQAADITQSLILDGEQGKAMPLWSDASVEDNVMVGGPSSIMVSDAYAFGVTNFDTATALTLMNSSATDPNHTLRSDIQDYNKLHYEPDNASVTEEYSEADFAISQFAAALGNTSMASEFAQRGQYWKNNFNPADGYIEPKASDGTWDDQPFDPTNTNGYVEGNGAVYNWMVPWNLQALFTMMGGDSAASSRMDSYASQLDANTSQPYLEMGNEPSFSDPWVYNSLLEPYKSQKLVRDIIGQLFGTTPDGYPGDDDLGAMSSWLVWAYLGMYPMIPGTDNLVLTGPYFSSETIHTASGGTIQVNGNGAGPGNQYTQTLSVNGSPSQQTWLHYGDVASGATLGFGMGSSPSTWGTAAADAPPSYDVGSASAVTGRGLPAHPR